MAATDAGNVLEQHELEAIHKMPRGNAAYFAGSTLTRVGFEERHMSLATGVGLHPLVTVESSLFPYLFERGAGFYQGPERLDHYLSMRMNALFTPFTLVREFVLIMAQILMATQLLNNVKARALEKAHEQELLARPNDTARDRWRRLAKRFIPGEVVGSPAYHKRHLQDLLTQVANKGIPSVFWTPTADEVCGFSRHALAHMYMFIRNKTDLSLLCLQTSEMRWQSIRDIEDLMAKWKPGATYKDAPVECALLFMNRVRNFMQEFILGGPMLLGRITDYLIRYEAQGRGSLHAHILL